MALFQAEEQKCHETHASERWLIINQCRISLIEPCSPQSVMATVDENRTGWNAKGGLKTFHRTEILHTPTTASIRQGPLSFCSERCRSVAAARPELA